MFTPSWDEGTGAPWVKQALRTASVWGLLLCARLLAPTPEQGTTDQAYPHVRVGQPVHVKQLSGGQQLPFTVTWVDWSADALARQGHAYRAESRKHEVLFCIERWRFEAPGEAYQRIVIERTRKEVNGERHHIPDVRSKCRNERGEALPTIHTHSDGNCQMSPRDLATIAQRGAEFDGVQCGDSYFVWAFAWQINAIVTSVSASKQATVPPTSIP